MIYVELTYACMSRHSTHTFQRPTKRPAHPVSMPVTTTVMSTNVISAHGLHTADYDIDNHTRHVQCRKPLSSVLGTSDTNRESTSHMRKPSSRKSIVKTTENSRLSVP